MEIRSATAGDADSLAALSIELGYTTDSQAVAERLARLMALEDHAVFVAEDDTGSMVGWIHVFGALRLESDPFAELGGLVVAAAQRRRGIGRLLCESARDWAQQRGYGALRVRTRIEREEAHKFYRRLGFRSAKIQRVFVLPLTGD
ncbi:MAG: GNAT family N-acetyltransferase [Acidobacteriota bacterium]